MALNILFNADDEKQDGYLDSFDSQGRGIDQQFVRGDQSLAVSLRPVVPNTSTNATRYWSDDHQTGDTYQVAIGNPDQAPTSGTFGLSLGGSTTGLTALTMDATVLTTQISAAHSASYGAVIAVLVSPGVFQVTWQTNGAIPQLVVATGNTLTPDSFVTTVVDKAGDASSKAIQYIVLRQSPVAYCEPSTAFATASVIASVTQAGDGTHNKKVSITLTPGVYAGSFSVTLTKADSSVSHLVASGTISQDAFATLLGVPCNVTREDDVIRVEFTGAQGLSNAPAIAVSNIDLLVPKGVSGLMDLNTVSLYRQFWVSGSSTSSLPFTLSIKRTRSSGELAEIFQHPVTLKRNIIDVTTMVDVTLGSYYTTTASDARFARKVERVIYASTVGCHLDSNVLTGGGTDDTVAIQNALNLLSSLGGGTFVLDGAALISDVNVSDSQFAALYQPPGVPIHCLTQDCGVYLADGSNCAMLSNSGITGDPDATFDKNIALIGGVYNGNCAHQTFRERNGDSTHFGVVGMWFGAFNGFKMHGVQIRDSKYFAIILSNGVNFDIQDYEAVWTNDLTGSSNKDTLHLYGTLLNGYVRNIKGNGDDDTIALNTDEGVFNYMSAVTYGKDRFPHSGGDLTNITIDDLEVVGTTGQHAYRFIGYETGTSNCDEITIRNVHGSVSGMDSGCDDVTIGRLTIDGWTLPDSTIVVTATNLCLSNIIPSADASGATGTNQYGDYFLQGANLPTSDPHVVGRLWNNAGTVKVSAGP